MSTPTEVPEQPAEAEVPVKAKLEWILTRQSKYLHRISWEHGEMYTACKWRKGVAQRKPIAPHRVIWQGERDAAVSMRIGFCPASVCQP